MKKIVLLFSLLALYSSSSLAVDLRVSTYTDVEGLDPHDTSATASYAVQSGIFERLFGFDENMSIEPVLAESYEGNEDATQFTVKLKQDIKFHDGEDFNASAAKANLDRLADQSLNLKRNSLFKLVDTVNVIDDYTIEINLKESFGAMIPTLAHPSAVMHSPKVLASNNKQTIADNPTGTGPFKFNSWEPNREVRLVKNEDYWQQGWPKVDNVIFYPTPEASTRIAKLKAGEVDAVYFLPSDLVDSVREDSELDIQQGTGIMQFSVALNNTRKELSDKRVRQAINYAVNKDIWLKVVFGSMGNRASSPLPPNVQFHEKQENQFDYDVDKAKSLMKEAGFEDGFEVELWSSDATDSVRTAQFIKQQLSQINITAKVVPMNSGTRSEKLWSVKSPEEAGFDMYVGGWSTSTGDADWALRPLYSSESWVPTAYNVSYYSNAEVDEAIQAALATANDAERKEAYSKAQKIIWEEQPVIFLGEPDTLVGKKANLEGVYMTADRSFSFNKAEFK